MISAVAARRARLKESNAPNPATPEPGPSTPPKTSLPTKGTKPPSKRKPSAQKAPESTRKKPRRSKAKPRAEDKRQRYFAGQEAQLDVIMLDDEDDDEVMSSSRESTPEDLDAASMLIPEPTLAPGPLPRKRAWSPSRPLRDSSDEEDAEAERQPFALQEAPADETAGPGFIPVLDQNTFSLSPEEIQSLQLSSAEPGALLMLPPDGTRLSLLGVCTLTVLQGTVSLFGATLTVSPTSHPIFAPRSSAIPVMRALPSEPAANPVNGIPACLKSQIGPDDVVIVLQEHRTGVEGLGRIVGTFDGVFSPPRKDDPSISELPVSGVHVVSQEMRDVQPFRMPPSWTEAIATPLPSNVEEGHVLPPPTALVRGPKNAGKSTFARTLLNALLSRYRRVAFLECDLGQSEFTPGGLVALTLVSEPVFGPPFTHLTQPHEAHYIGASSPRSAPSHYLRAIEALVQTYTLDLQYATSLPPSSSPPSDTRITDAVPLVVNTMGWTKGLGASLATKLTALVNPTHIFALDAPEPSTFWPSAPAPPENETETPVHTITPITPITPSPSLARWTAADHRALALLSYLHSIPPSPQRPTLTWNTSLPLIAHRPYELDTRAALAQIVLAGPGAEDVVPHELPRVLNGALVAFVARTSADPNSNPDSPAPLYTQAAAPPDPFASRCAALALVRAASASGEQLHVLAPALPPPDARVLVKGELELPVWGFLDFRSVGMGGEVAGVPGERVPFLRWGRGEGVGAERRRVRRNLMRRGQM